MVVHGLLMARSKSLTIRTIIMYIYMIIYLGIYCVSPLTMHSDLHMCLIIHNEVMKIPIRFRAKLLNNFTRHICRSSPMKPPSMNASDDNEVHKIWCEIRVKIYVTKITMRVYFFQLRVSFYSIEGVSFGNLNFHTHIFYVTSCTFCQSACFQ